MIENEKLPAEERQEVDPCTVAAALSLQYGPRLYTVDKQTFINFMAFTLAERANKRGENFSDVEREIYKLAAIIVCADEEAKRQESGK